MNEIILSELFGRNKKLIEHIKTKECEIEYYMNDKILIFIYRSDEKYFENRYENISFSNMKKILDWIRKENLEKLEKICIKY